MSDDQPYRLVRHALPAIGDHALVLHGGAGEIMERPERDQQSFRDGLAAAHRAGTAVLRAGGAALDAVCAAVQVLEDHELFNAGRGAALTADGEAELDASVMTGDGRAGAIAASRYARNPVLLARQVMERTPHVLITAPDRELVAGFGLPVVEPEHFVTEARRRQLAKLQAAGATGPRHGTVGAVARDRNGELAAATSTGGMTNQQRGRVGDTPVIGAGTYARNRVVAVSCTGEGEAFIRGVVAYDIAARIRYGGADLATAVTGTITEELTERQATGGLVAVDADGSVLVAHNSPTIFAAYEDDGTVVTLI